MNYYRHPREGGDPSFATRHPHEGGDLCCHGFLDSRPTSPGYAGQALRGNDVAGAPDSRRFLDSRPGFAGACVLRRVFDLRGNDVVPALDVGRRTPRKPRGRLSDLGPKFAFLILNFALLLAASPAKSQPLRQDEVGSPLTSHAVSPRFTHLKLEDGLSQGTILALHEDKNGFMWIGTQDGLNRYDGYEIKVFESEPFDDETVSSSWINDIDEDADGALWLATRRGLSRMDPVTEKFSSFRNDPDNETSIPDDALRDVLVDSEGRIWTASRKGVARMDAERKGVFERFEYDPADSTSLCHPDAFSLFEDSSGLIWVGTENGLGITDRKNPGAFECVLNIAHPPIYFYNTPEGEVDGMLERPQEPGVLWVGTSAGLVRLDVASRRTELFVPHPDYTGTNRRFNQVLRLAQDPTNPGVLWVPTYGGGLTRFDIRTKQFITYSADPENPDGMLQDAATLTFADRSGMVWVGTETQGLSRFNPASVSFAHYRSSPNNRNSLPGRTVYGIFQSKDGVVWVGTTDDTGHTRLSALNRETGAIRNYEHNPSNPASLDRGTNVAILEDHLGNMWVGTSLGLDRLDRSTGRFTHFRSDPDNPNAPGSLPPFSVLSIFEDRSGKLWVGTIGGLGWMGPERDGRFTRIARDPDDPETLIPAPQRDIFEDLAGFIWTAGGGVSRIDPETGKVTRYLPNPEDSTTLAGYPEVLLERRREPGIIWAGSGEGLNRLDSETGIVTHFTVRDGLPNNTVYGLLEDDDGRIWISTNHGLSRFEPETKTFKNFGAEIGLQGLEFDNAAFFRGLNGEMFFGGTNGLNAFFPNELTENINAPQVELVDLKLSNESIKSTGAIKLDRPLQETDGITLDHTQKEVTFDFVAIHYANPKGNQYAYKLEGFNDDWVYVGRQRTATFTNLAPGSYTFRVKAANSDGVWNEEGASIRLIVEPPFWATWWFRLLAVVGFGGLLYVGYSLRVRQIAERNQALEAEVGKRTAELKESRDQLELTNEQLEQSHTIVEAINQETSFRRLLTKILEESRVIPGVEKATALVRMVDDHFHVRASSGWDVSEMQHIQLTRKQAHQRYVEQAEEVGKNIFVAKNVVDRAGTEEMAEFGQVASFLVLRVMVEGDVTAYLVFDNLSDPEAFDQRDIALLERLREHIQSAFIKTRILEDLQHTLDDLRSTQDRLIQSEKMASLGQLTAGIAHEIKNPLNFVNNFSDVTAEVASEMAEELASRRNEIPADLAADFEQMIESLTRNAQKIAEHGRRADAIVKNMLEHSKVGEGERTSINLNELLDEYVTLAAHALEARGGMDVHIQRSYDDSIGRVDLVPQDMGRVLMNLISNAFDALKGHGAPNGEPTVRVVTSKSDGWIEIRVADNGPGIPPKVLAKIFEPFFTTKPTGSGTGLGLSMSYDIVTKGHGGTLDVESEEGKGATFIVRLPV